MDAEGITVGLKSNAVGMYRVTFTGNIIYNTATDAINYFTNGSLTGSDAMIASNVFESIGAGAVTLEADTGAPIKRVSVTGNVAFAVNGPLVSGNGDHSYISTTGNVGEDLNRVGLFSSGSDSHISFIGNVARTVSADAFDMAGTTEMVLAGNQLTDLRNNAVNGGSGVISSNLFVSNGNDATGLNLFDPEVQVVGNYVANFGGAGIDCRDNYQTVSGNLAKNNNQQGYTGARYSGVALRANYQACCGNTCINTQSTATQNYGVHDGGTSIPSSEMSSTGTLMEHTTMRTLVARRPPTTSATRRTSNSDRAARRVI